MTYLTKNKKHCIWVGEQVVERIWTYDFLKLGNIETILKISGGRSSIPTLPSRNKTLAPVVKNYAKTYPSLLFPEAATGDVL